MAQTSKIIAIELFDKQKARGVEQPARPIAVRARRFYQQSSPPKMDVWWEGQKPVKALFLWAVSQSGEKERKASDPRGERPFEPFLIVPSEMGHSSSELKCLVGWPAPETKERPHDMYL